MSPKYRQPGHKKRQMAQLLKITPPVSGGAEKCANDLFYNVKVAFRHVFSPFIPARNCRTRRMMCAAIAWRAAAIIPAKSTTRHYITSRILSRTLSRSGLPAKAPKCVSRNSSRILSRGGRAALQRPSQLFIAHMLTRIIVIDVVILLCG